MHQTGDVIVTGIVQTDGSIRDAEVQVSSYNPLLDAAAVSCVSGWIYRPLQKDGRPVEIRMHATITFALDGQQAALSDLNSALIWSPNNAILLFDRAKYYAAEKPPRSDLAKADIARAAEIGFSDPFLYLRMARIQLQLNDSAVERTLDKAVDMAPENIMVLKVRGDYLLQTKKYDEALADYRSILKIDPSNRGARLAAGEVFASLNQLDQARSAYNGVLAEEGRNDIAARGALYWRGRLSEHEGKPELAIQDYHRLAELEFSFGAYNQSCWASATHNLQLEQAENDCRAGIALAPQNAAIWDSLAFVLFRESKFTEALEAYEKSYDLDSKQRVSLFMRGVTKKRLGRSDGDADIAEALKSDPKIAERYAGYGVQP